MRVKKDSLIDAVKAARLFTAPKNASLQIATKILIDAEKCHVIGTDLENFAVTSVHFEDHSCESFLVDKDFHKILKACPADDAGMIELTVKTFEDTEGLIAETSMAVCVGKFKEITISSGDDFPNLPVFNALENCGEKYSPSALSEISKITVGSDDLREYLTHMYVNGEKLEAVSTDGNMIAKVELEDLPYGLKNMMLPKVALLGAGKIFSNDMKLTVDRGAGYAVLQDRYERSDIDGATRIIIRTIMEPNYPNYTPLYQEKSSDHTVHVNSKAVISALKNVKLMSGKGCSGVRIMANGGLSIRIENPEKGIFHEEAIPFKEGDLELDEPRYVLINADFMITALKSSKADVEICFPEKYGAPLGVTSDTGLIKYMIMPMRDKELKAEKKTTDVDIVSKDTVEE